jgi:hypothetical protein
MLIASVPVNELGHWLSDYETDSILIASENCSLHFVADSTI